MSRDYNGNKSTQIIKKLTNKSSVVDNIGGSTLVLTFMAIMLISVATVGFLTAISGFVTRTWSMHYEKQVYLSARSASKAIASIIEDDSYNRIMVLEPDIRLDMPELPFELQTGETSTVVLTSQQKQLLADLDDMEEDDVIELGEVKFNNTPASVQMGKVTAIITKDVENRYVVSATSTLEGEGETVKTLLVYNDYRVGTDEERIPEIDGNWEGFFMDFGFNLGTDGILNNVNGLEGANAAVTTPIYESTIIGGVYSTKEVIMVDGAKENGPIKTSSSIYLEDVVVRGDDSEIFAGESLMIVGAGRETESGEPAMTTTVKLESTKITVKGESIALLGGTDDQEIICEIMIIDGEDITISAPITCDEIYIIGERITISAPIIANKVYMSGTELDIADTKALRAYVAFGTTNLYERPITTEYGYVIYGGEIVYEEVNPEDEENEQLVGEIEQNTNESEEVDIDELAQESLETETTEESDTGQNDAEETDDEEFKILVLSGEINDFKYDILADEEMEEVEIKLTEFTAVTRSKPIWANYEATDVQLFDATQIGPDVWWGRPDVEQMTSGYYFIDKDTVEPETIITTIEINGVEYQREEFWNVLELDNAVERGGRSADNPLVIIVRDGQNLRLDTLSGYDANWSGDYIYFILEGNAKIQIPQGATYARIYGEAPTVQVYDEVQDAIQEVIGYVIEEADGDYTQIDFDLAKTYVHDIMNWYYDDLSMILAPNGGTLVGNAIIPYIMTDNKDFSWQFIEYEGETLEFDDLGAEVPENVSYISESQETFQYDAGITSIEELRAGYSLTSDEVQDEYRYYEFVGFIK